MVTEKRSLTVVWNNVRKMRSRERQSEIMDWIERSNCDVCAVNETGRMERNIWKLEMDPSREEREVKKERILKLKEIIQKEKQHE